MSALFLLVTQKKRDLSNTYVNLFHFGQYVIWLVMYGVWVLTLREVRVIALFCALMPLTFLLADTKMLQSLVIAISAIVIQIAASHYAPRRLTGPDTSSRAVTSMTAVIVCHVEPPRQSTAIFTDGKQSTG